MSTSPLYNTDFYGWTQHQAAALRSGNFTALDLDNLIDEVESMGKSEKRELESRLEILLMHLLKWQYQPDFRSTSWQASIIEQRYRVADHLQENPSLKAGLADTCQKAYRYAVLGAVKETGIGKIMFPLDCPWTFEQAMDADFWPGN